VITPVGVILPILFALYSVNHTLPSGPVVIPSGPPLGTGYSVKLTWATQKTAAEIANSAITLIRTLGLFSQLLCGGS
jgi:hypothetical protein